MVEMAWIRTRFQPLPISGLADCRYLIIPVDMGGEFSWAIPRFARVLDLQTVQRPYPTLYPALSPSSSGQRIHIQSLSLVNSSFSNCPHYRPRVSPPYSVPHSTTKSCTFGEEQRLQNSKSQIRYFIQASEISTLRRACASLPVRVENTFSSILSLNFSSLRFRFCNICFIFNLLYRNLLGLYQFSILGIGHGLKSLGQLT
jgi:hypothetical protein